MEFRPSYFYSPFGIDRDADIIAIIGDDLWQRSVTWAEDWNQHFDPFESTGEHFGSEEVRARIDREYVALAMEIQDKLPPGEYLDFDMCW